MCVENTMPPKKGSSQKPPKARTPTLIDGLSKEEMSKEQMEEHIVRLREELDREREERNYYQTERDKIHALREITERQVDEAKAELNNLSRDVEEDMRRQQAELKVYKQKMKHLLCEDQNRISELKAGALVKSEARQREQHHVESELQWEMKTIKDNMQDFEIESLLKEIQQKHGEEMHETRSRLEKQAKDFDAEQYKKIEMFKEELENERKREVADMGDYFIQHVHTLKEANKKILSDINAHTQEFDLLTMEKTLREERKDCEEIESKLRFYVEDNERAKIEMLEIEGEIAAEKKKMKKNVSMKLGRKGPNYLQQLDDVKKDNMDLEQKIAKLRLETDELHRGFDQEIQEVQQRAGFRAEQLERQLSDCTERLEKAQIQLHALHSDPNIDQSVLQGEIRQIEEKLDSYNNTIKDLQQKKAQISRAKKML